jgi:hypothetical protein
MIPISTLKKTGRSSRISAVLGILIAVLSIGAARPARAAEAESFLLPGIDMRSIEFKVGAWCRYRVIDEAMGETDTTLVYLAVVGSEKTATGTAYWLEVESRVPGRSDAERDAARALVDGRIHSMAEGDSIHAYITRFYTRKGKDAPQKGNPADLRKLTLVSPVSASDWKTESQEPLATPAGKFVCEHRVFDRTESRDVPSGRIVIKQKRSDHVEIYTAPSVPLFHLVESVIDRTRESRTVPAVKGIPETGPRQSRTTSVLIAHGAGAKSVFPTVK